MKKTLFKLILFGCFWLVLSTSCQRDTNYSLVPTKHIKTEDLFTSLREGVNDTTGFNFDMHGQFLFHHLKYYPGTIDPLTFLPEGQKDLFLSEFNNYQRKIQENKWNHDQIIDDLVNQKSYTPLQGQLIKEHQQAVLKLIASQPDAQTVLNWFSEKEKEIIANPKLSQSEKSELLNQRSMVKYSLLWRLEQKPSDLTVKGARTQACGFWEKLACYVGNISGLSGVGGAIGGSTAIKAAGDALGRATAIGAIVGVSLGIVQSFTTCQCSSGDVNICDAPLTVTYPYECYTPGNSIQVTAIGYGTIPPTQFTWNFYYNDDLNNGLYSNATGVDYIYLPGNKISQFSANDFAVKVYSHCAANGGTPQQDIPSQVFGWININQLGRPYFSIYGTDNFTVSQIQNSPFSNYGISGVYSSTGATVQWEIIPSGYPNYSATGVFSSNNSTTTTGSFVQVRWNSNPGFATLKCTTSAYCNGSLISEVQYFNIHIQ